MSKQKRWIRKPTGIYSVVILLATIAHTESFTGKVVGVTDGDTISVMREGKADKVRLYGIDCPELGQAFGTKAKQFTSEQCFGQIVTVEATGTDRYGRTIGTIELPDGRNLNHELVAAGMAWWYRVYAKDDKKLAVLHDEAKDAGIGLWSDPAAVAPWTYRRNPLAGIPVTRSVTPKERSQPVTRPPPRVEGEKEVRARREPIMARPPTTIVVPEQEQDVSETKVYVTRTGKKYHRSGCRYLSKSKKSISLSAAKARYSACSVCRP